MALERISIVKGTYTAQFTTAEVKGKYKLLCNGEVAGECEVKTPTRGKAKLVIDLPNMPIDANRNVFTIVDGKGKVLDVFSFGMENTDIQNELDQLRAEVDMLKSAFRREMRARPLGKK